MFKIDISKAVRNALPFSYCLKTSFFKITHNYFSFGCSVTLAHCIF